MNSRMVLNGTPGSTYYILSEYLIMKFVSKSLCKHKSNLLGISYKCQIKYTLDHVICVSI